MSHTTETDVPAGYVRTIYRGRPAHVRILGTAGPLRAVAVRFLAVLGDLDTRSDTFVVDNTDDLTGRPWGLGGNEIGVMAALRLRAADIGVTVDAPGDDPDYLRELDAAAYAARLAD